MAGELAQRGDLLLNVANIVVHGRTVVAQHRVWETASGAGPVIEQIEARVLGVFLVSSVGHRDLLTSPSRLARTSVGCPFGHPTDTQPKAIGQ
ncbi:hypothetical protein SDC9_123516 [bioreactor metagenome]|uniref:Uncharacterized protein n=1 Tax=bioreactor metagenome TaxID=1076179 RepID=A0A645CHX7_9ZZZZ